MIIRTLFLATCLLHPLAQVQAASLDVTTIPQRAAQGDVQALVQLGNRYYHGNGLPQDFGRAQAAIGTLYYHGAELEQDLAQAASWLRKAAEQGDTRGQTLRGVMYYKGQSVAQDKGVAYAWLSLATAGGKPLPPGAACCRTGQGQRAGQGVCRAIPERWLRR